MNGRGIPVLCALLGNCLIGAWSAGQILTANNPGILIDRSYREKREFRLIRTIGIHKYYAKPKSLEHHIYRPRNGKYEMGINPLSTGEIACHEFDHADSLNLEFYCEDSSNWVQGVFAVKLDSSTSHDDRYLMSFFAPPVRTSALDVGGFRNRLIRFRGHLFYESVNTTPDDSDMGMALVLNGTKTPNEHGLYRIDRYFVRSGYLIRTDCSSESHGMVAERINPSCGRRAGRLDIAESKIQLRMV